MLDKAKYTKEVYFVLGAPLHERPSIEEHFKKYAGAIAKFPSLSTTEQAFRNRIKDPEKSALVYWEKTPARSNVDLYAKNDGVEVLRMTSSPDGEYQLLKLNKGEAKAGSEQVGMGGHENSFHLDSAEYQHLLFNPSMPTTPPSNVGRIQDQVEPTDITVVICVRAHELNPWLMDRLAILPELYDPKPRFLIVDFGSAEPFASKVEDLCVSGGLKHIYVDDSGVFSAAKARNAGFSHCETDLIFFSDIDFVFYHDFFRQVSSLASSLGAVSYVDVPLMANAVHVSESATSKFVSLESREERTAFLYQLGNDSVYDSDRGLTQFSAPYSNIFLINRKLFKISGGYDESFRGHGSEDFEFVSRLTYYTGQFPAPADLSKDIGRPLKGDFSQHKKYEGFRALNAAYGLQGALQGLKAFHLYHPTLNSDPWRSNNDWKRERLRSVIGSYERTPERLLSVDFLRGPKRAMCVCYHRDQWGYFAPLREMGYEIVPLYEGSVAERERAAEQIARGEIDLFAIFNPYMQSHMRFQPLFQLARERTKVMVIERGALPGTVYYSNDVAYNSDEYSDDAFDAYQPTSSELTAAKRYISDLRKGGTALEKGATYDFTARKYTALTAVKKKIVFVPTQLEDDMAVTMFVRDAQSYQDFYNSINSVAAAHEDCIFLVKPHPLSKGGIPIRGSNIVVADREDSKRCPAVTFHDVSASARASLS